MSRGRVGRSIKQPKNKSIDTKRMKIGQNAMGLAQGTEQLEDGVGSDMINRFNLSVSPASTVQSVIRSGRPPRASSGRRCTTSGTSTSPRSARRRRRRRWQRQPTTEGTTLGSGSSLQTSPQDGGKEEGPL